MPPNERKGMTQDCGPHCFRRVPEGEPPTAREYHCKRKCCHGKSGKHAKRRKKLW